MAHPVDVVERGDWAEITRLAREAHQASEFSVNSSAHQKFH